MAKITPEQRKKALAQANRDDKKFKAGKLKSKTAQQVKAENDAAFRKGSASDRAAPVKDKNGDGVIGGNLNLGDGGDVSKRDPNNPFPRGSQAAKEWEDMRDAEAMANRFTPDDTGAYEYTDPYKSERSIGQGNAFGYMAGIDPLTGRSTGTYGGDMAGNIKDVLARMQSGLEGYAAPELQAFREQAQQGVDTSYYTRLRELKSAQATSNVRGASALAQQNNLLRGRTTDQQNLEQNLFLKQADERQRRLKEYSDTVEQNRAGQQEAVGKLGNWQALANASDAATQTANIGEKWKQRSFKGANLFGQAALAAADKQQKWTNDFYEKNADKFGQGASSGGGGNPAYAAGLQSLIDNFKNILGTSANGNQLSGNSETGF